MDKTATAKPLSRLGSISAESLVYAAAGIGNLAMHATGEISFYQFTTLFVLTAIGMTLVGIKAKLGA